MCSSDLNLNVEHLGFSRASENDAGNEWRINAGRHRPNIADDLEIVIPELLDHGFPVLHLGISVDISSRDACRIELSLNGLRMGAINSKAESRPSLTALDPCRDDVSTNSALFMALPSWSSA